MARREDHGAPDGTPTEDEVEQDFTVPADADLRPASDDPAAGDATT